MQDAARGWHVAAPRNSDEPGRRAAVRGKDRGSVRAGFEQGVELPELGRERTLGELADFPANTPAEAALGGGLRESARLPGDSKKCIRLLEP